MVMQACDHLMAELLRREAQNSSVRDAAVSADAAVGSVEVEVVAEGADEWDAQQAALRSLESGHQSPRSPRSACSYGSETGPWSCCLLAEVSRSPRRADH
jgi:hypothetical protein